MPSAASSRVKAGELRTRMQVISPVAIDLGGGSTRWDWTSAGFSVWGKVTRVRAPGSAGDMAGPSKYSVTVRYSPNIEIGQRLVINDLQVRVLSSFDPDDERAILKLDCVGVFSETVKIEQRTGVDEYAQPKYEGGTTYWPARVERKMRMIRSLTNEERVSSAAVYLEGIVSLHPDARITLPDGSQPIILSTSTYQDEAGRFHTVLFI